MQRLLKNLRKIFSGYNLLWQLAAFLITYVLVTSGFDWQWYLHFKNSPFEPLFFSAAIVGGFLPILMPPVMLAVGTMRKKKWLVMTAWALAQAQILAWFISSFYKSLTGRIPPEQLHTASLFDSSRGFHFGFLEKGIFWGWPSSHTAVAFAGAATLMTLFPRNAKVKLLAPLYALYIGIGVSTNIHWFSDFAAGAIVGTVIGLVVGQSFRPSHVPH